jgi:hypothetical protein
MARCASGRVEWDMLFPEKDKKYHAAAGEIRRYREQTIRLNAHHVTLT